MINRLFRSWFWPVGAQLVTLAAFVLLIFGGLAADTSDPAFAKVLRNTNLANLVVWSYWWPLIIIASIFLGRVWCMICPVELVTSLAARIGWKRPLPKIFRRGWVVTALYVAILFVGIHVLAIHRVPYRMALYMIALFGLAIITGLIFAKNAFCSSVCPIGHLLGLYARHAPLGWGVRDADVCGSCADKSCVAQRHAYRFQGRSCGVGLSPKGINDNTECLLCGQCLKACDWNKQDVAQRPNPGWFSKPFGRDLFALQPLTGAQVVFALVVSGFVIYEVLTEWKVSKQLLLYGPDLVRAQLQLSGPWAVGLTKSVLLFALLPALLWLLPYGVFRMGGGRLSFGRYARSWGMAFLPIMAAAHVVKGLLKMVSRTPYWERTLDDPLGIATASGVLDKSLVLGAPSSAWAPLLTVVALALVTGGTLLSLVLVRKLNGQLAETDRRGTRAFFLIPGIYGGLFLVMLIAWRLF